MMTPSTLAARRGIEIPRLNMEPQALYRQRQYDLLADAVRESLDLDAIYRAMEDYDT